MDDLKQSVIASIEKIIRESQTLEGTMEAARQGIPTEALAARLIYRSLMEEPIAPPVKPPAAPTVPDHWE